MLCRSLLPHALMAVFPIWLGFACCILTHHVDYLCSTLGRRAAVRIDRPLLMDGPWALGTPITNFLSCASRSPRSDSDACTSRASCSRFRGTRCECEGEFRYEDKAIIGKNLGHVGICQSIRSRRGMPELCTTCIDTNCHRGPRSDHCIRVQVAPVRVFS